MSGLKRLAALALAVIVPPLGSYLVRGPRVGVWINLALFCAAHLTFWLFAAAPGLAVMGLAVVHAVVLCLLPMSSRPEAMTT